jgi:aminomethyltransferase
MGYCLYGHELDETTSPIEAGLGWITSLKEGKDLIGRDCLQSRRKTAYHAGCQDLSCLRKQYPATDMRFLTAMASYRKSNFSTMSPVLKQGIGMGYVAHGSATPGQ